MVESSSGAFENTSSIFVLRVLPNRASQVYWVWGLSKYVVISLLLTRNDCGIIICDYNASLLRCWSLRASHLIELSRNCIFFRSWMWVPRGGRWRLLAYSRKKYTIPTAQKKSQILGIDRVKYLRISSWAQIDKMRWAVYGVLFEYYGDLGSQKSVLWGPYLSSWLIAIDRRFRTNTVL